MSYGCKLINEMVLIVDIIFDKSANAVNIQMTGPNESVLSYFNHALAMIVNLWAKVNGIKEEWYEIVVH